MVENLCSNVPRVIFEQKYFFVVDQVANLPLIKDGDWHLDSNLLYNNSPAQFSDVEKIQHKSLWTPFRLFGGRLVGKLIIGQELMYYLQVNSDSMHEINLQMHELEINSSFEIIPGEIQ